MELRSSLRHLMNNFVIAFIIRPLTLTRTLAWVFSLIVSGSLASSGYQNTSISSKLNCILNDNHAACGYGIGVGIAGFLVCLVFLMLDAFESYFVKPLTQKIILLADIVCSVLWAVLWFIGFCFLTHEWILSPYNRYPLGTEVAQTSIAFSFASIPCWGVLSYLAGLRFLSTPADAYERSLEEGILSDMSKVSSTSTVQLHGSQNGSITTSFQLPSFGGQSPTFNY
ncbi:hypothetical protein FKM82_013428 [Ascaphus truei]|uniref:synaptogyrin-4 n=1 Tax=Ascaphus truei TaxID=8439 RepID=UPI003F5A4CD0